MRRLMLVAVVLLAPVLHLTKVGGADVNLGVADPLVALASLWLAWRFFHEGIEAPLLGLLCATAAVTLLSLVVNAEITFFARSPLGVAVTMLKSLFPWLYFYVPASLVRSPSELRLLLGAWVAGSGAVAASGVAGSLLYQIAGLENRFALAYRAHGTLGDANFFGMHLGVSFFLAVLYRRLAGGGWWVAPVMALQTLGLFFSASRSGLIGFACGLLLWTVFGAPLRWKLATAAAAGALAAAVALAPRADRWLESNPVAARLATTTIDVEATDRARLWAFAFGRFMESPLAGVGYENIPYVNRTIPGRPTETHNTYLNMMSETGLAGLVVYLAVLLYYPLALLGDWRRQRTGAGAGALCLLAAFANIGAVGMAVNVENYRGLWVLMAASHAFRRFRSGPHPAAAAKAGSTQDSSQ